VISFSAGCMGIKLVQGSCAFGRLSPVWGERKAVGGDGKFGCSLGDNVSGRTVEHISERMSRTVLGRVSIRRVQVGWS